MPHLISQLAYFDSNWHRDTSRMSTLQRCPFPALAKVEGFEVVVSPHSSPQSGSRHPRPKKSVSLLSLEISSSLSSGVVDLTDDDLTETDCFTDDEPEECDNRRAVPIVIKDEEAYKVMLRARAVVNCRLWQSST